MADFNIISQLRQILSVVGFSCRCKSTDLKFRFALWVCISLKTTLAFAGGFVVGNGGDVVICGPSTGKPVAGIYARDYLLSNATVLPLRHIKNFQDSLQQIHTLLSKHSPNLSESFGEFKSNWLNSTNYGSKHIWEAAPFGLQTISEQDELLSIPEGCKDAAGKPNSRQVIVRTFSQTSQLPSKKRLFKFDPEIVSELELKNPLQLSFLAIHEWLWEVSQDEISNRRLVVFLHQDDLESLSVEQFLTELSNRGLVGFSADTPDTLPDTSAQCSGPSITQDDFDSRFNSPKAPFAFGKLETKLWTKMENCAGEPVCFQKWTNTNHQLHPEHLEPSLIYWKKRSDDNFPIKIMSPELIANGTFPNDPNSALFQCSLPKSDTEGLQCQFAQKGWEIFTNEKTPKNDFVFEAKWTRTCFDLKSSFNANEVFYETKTLPYKSNLQIVKQIRWPD